MVTPRDGQALYELGYSPLALLVSELEGLRLDLLAELPELGERVRSALDEPRQVAP